jgi:AraC-like DNA-binding protein
MPNAPRATTEVAEPPSLGDTEASRLWLPRASLAHCVRAVISRKTTHLRLSEPQRYNHFPVSPSCGLWWMFEGGGEMLATGAPAHPDSPRVRLPLPLIFNGPNLHPIISWNPGPVHGLMLVIQPDALALLTGIDPGVYIDRVVAAQDVLPPDWLTLSQTIFDAPNDAQRVTLIEDFLDPRWQAVRPRGLLHSHVLADWQQGLTLRAATSGLGRSLRQMERRIKQWTGQPLRELRGMSRAERMFFDTILALDQGDVNWTELASDAGYTDQSHFCRQTRRFTGFSPEELRRHIAEEESFWAYRLWGFAEPRHTSALATVAPAEKTGPDLN